MDAVLNFIKDIIIAVGGGLGIALIILRLCKGIIQKWVETTIETTAEKSLAKYSNTLERKTLAYEMLINKEFDFYECTSKILCDLIENTQNYTLYLGVNKKSSALIDFDKAYESYNNITKTAFSFISEHTMSHYYLPEEISDACISLIQNLTGAVTIFVDGLNSMSKNNLDESMCDKIRKSVESILDNCANFNVLVNDRIIKLSTYE